MEPILPASEHQNMNIESHVHPDTQTTGESLLDLDRMRGQKRNASVQTDEPSPPRKRIKHPRDRSTQTPEDGIILQETTQAANTLTGETELSVVDQVISEGNNPAFLSESSKKNKESTLSVGQSIMHDTDSHDPSRLEISGGREEDDMNPDSRMDITETSNQIAMNESCLMNPESLKNTEQSADPHSDTTEPYSDTTEPYSDNTEPPDNEEIQEFDSLGNRSSIIELTSASNMNVTENDSDSSNGMNEMSDDDNGPFPASASVSHANSPESNLSVQLENSPFKLQATEDAIEVTASNMNISQDENLPENFSDESNNEKEF